MRQRTVNVVPLGIISERVTLTAGHTLVFTGALQIAVRLKYKLRLIKSDKRIGISRLDRIVVIFQKLLGVSRIGIAGVKPPRLDLVAVSQSKLRKHRRPIPSKALAAKDRKRVAL
jgi:hypothetical protein